MTFDFPRMVRAWLAEDAAGRDVTPRGLFGPSARVRAVIVVRARGVLAGCLPAGAVFRAADARCAIRWLVRDGRSVRAGQPVASIIGPVRAVLACERTALNVLSRLSGIATLTARYVRAAARVPVYATRKTAPGLRVFEKRAVEAGGGKAHRMDLSSGVLVKDNHLAALRACGIPAAEALRRICRGRRAEVEAKTLAEVRLTLAAGARVIMLDGMSPQRLRRALSLIRAIPLVVRTPYGLPGADPGFVVRRGRPSGRPAVEISGGVTLRNIRALARLRPDRISVGAITHSAPSLDFSLDILSVGGHHGHRKSIVKR